MSQELHSQDKSWEYYMFRPVKRDADMDLNTRTAQYSDQDTLKILIFFSLHRKYVI